MVVEKRKMKAHQLDYDVMMSQYLRQVYYLHGTQFRRGMLDPSPRGSLSKHQGLMFFDYFYRNRDETRSTPVDNSRNWASSTSLSTAKEDNAESAKRLSGNTVSSDGSRLGGTPASWTSTPDLANLSNTTHAVSFNLVLPKRKPPQPTQPTDTGQQGRIFILGSRVAMQFFSWHDTYPSQV